MNAIAFDTLNLKELATKGDLAVLKNELKSEIVQLEQRMIIKLGMMIFAAVGAALALAKLFF